ncbi:MAG TPA: flagellar hook-length control protein FliK [Phycisphaerales bacterium]|nr:flagellar hook-length control protein FliK [Phycisphaerales bacterium]
MPPTPLQILGNPRSTPAGLGSPTGSGVDGLLGRAGRRSPFDAALTGTLLQDRTRRLGATAAQDWEERAHPVREAAESATESRDAAESRDAGADAGEGVDPASAAHEAEGADGAPEGEEQTPESAAAGSGSDEQSGDGSGGGSEIQGATKSVPVSAAIAQAAGADIRALNAALLQHDGWARQLLAAPLSQALTGGARGDGSTTSPRDEASNGSESEGREASVNTTTQRGRAGAGAWRTSPFDIGGRPGVWNHATGADTATNQAGGATTTGVRGEAPREQARDSGGPTRDLASSGSVGAGAASAGATAGADPRRIHAGPGAVQQIAAREGKPAPIGIQASASAGAQGSGVHPLKSLAFQGTLRQAGAARAQGEATTRAQHTPFDAQVRTLRTQGLRGIAAALNTEDKSVTLKLEPATLGEMRVKLDMSEGGVRAQFEVSSSEARRLLDRSLGELRHALEARGLSVERIDVSLATRAESQDASAAQNHRSETGQQQHAEAWSQGQPQAGDPRAGGGRGDGAGLSPRDAGATVAMDGAGTEDRSGEPGEARRLAFGIDAIA